MNIKLLATSLTCVFAIGASAFAAPEKKGGNNRGGADRPNPEEIVVELIADYDTSRDNSLSADELASGLEGMHEKRIADMEARRAERMANNGGDEARGERPNRGSREMDHVEVAGNLLERFDGNTDGSLDSEELLQALKSMNNRKGGKKGGRKSE